MLEQVNWETLDQPDRLWYLQGQRLSDVTRHLKRVSGTWLAWGIPWVTYHARYVKVIDLFDVSFYVWITAILWTRASHHQKMTKNRVYLTIGQFRFTQGAFSANTQTRTVIKGQKSERCPLLEWMCPLLMFVLNSKLKARLDMWIKPWRCYKRTK